MSPDRGLDEDALALFRVYRATGDRALRDRLVLQHRWIIERCAHRFDHRGEPIDDLQQVAAMALVRAVDRFDPDHGSSFASFAVPTVLGALKRHFRDATWRVKVPRRSRDLLTVVKQSIDALHQQLGRSPTVDEVADATGLDRQAVIETIAADRTYRMLSIDLPADAEGGRSIADAMPVADGGLLTADVRADLLHAVRDLDERLRCILVWRFYEDRTQAEIGRRLGIGQVQVSRLLRHALTELRHALEDAPTVG